MRKIVFFPIRFKAMKKRVFFDSILNVIRKTSLALIKARIIANCFDRWIDVCLLDSVAVWCTVKSDQINRMHQQTGQHTHPPTNFRMFDMQSNNTGLREFPFPFPFAMHFEKRFRFWQKHAVRSLVHDAFGLPCWIVIYVAQIVSITPFVQCKHIDGVEKVQFVVGAFAPSFRWDIDFIVCCRANIGRAYVHVQCTLYNETH